MSLTARAEVLADLSEPASESAECFCRARCAGMDIKAIAPVAKAALRLGAEQASLYRDAPPYAADAGYLDELQAIRVHLARIIEACRKLSREAHDQAVMAMRAMRAAAAAHDAAAYSAALTMYTDAVTASELSYDTAQVCMEAIRLMLTADADFRWIYEEPETLVAAGHVMPHRGRWLTGEQPAARHPAHVGTL